MANAKEELLSIVKDWKIVCANLVIDKGDRDKYESIYDDNGELIEEKFILDKGFHVESKLNTGYSKQELEEFLTSIDVEYDDGYGGQELFGLVLLEKEGVKAFLGRHEYDGSEHWRFIKVPSEQEVISINPNHNHNL
jgi:hypothetical protein